MQVLPAAATTAACIDEMSQRNGGRMNMFCNARLTLEDL